MASAALVGSWILQNDINTKQTKLHQLEIQKTDIQKKLEQTSTDKSKLEKQSQDQSKSIQDQQDQLKSKDDQINTLNGQLQARIEQKRQLALTATAEAAAPSAVSYSGDIQGIIVAAANEFGVSPSYLLSIARCESTFNPNASNGTHFGLFQFLPSTYAANAPKAGAGSDYWNPTNNARTAAYMFAHGQSGQWECKG